jgi:hypothetical protein
MLSVYAAQATPAVTATVVKVTTDMHMALRLRRLAVVLGIGVVPFPG